MSEIIGDGENDELAENPQPEADADISTENVESSSRDTDRAEGDVLNVEANEDLVESESNVVPQNNNQEEGDEVNICVEAGGNVGPHNAEGESLNGEANAEPESHPGNLETESNHFANGRGAEITDRAEGDVLNVGANAEPHTAHVESESEYDVSHSNRQNDNVTHGDFSVGAEIPDDDDAVYCSQTGDESESAESEMGSVSDVVNNIVPLPSGSVDNVTQENVPSTLNQVSAAAAAAPVKTSSDQAPECDQPFEAGAPCPQEVLVRNATPELNNSDTGCSISLQMCDSQNTGTQSDSGNCQSESEHSVSQNAESTASATQNNLNCRKDDEHEGMPLDDSESSNDSSGFSECDINNANKSTVSSANNISNGDNHNHENLCSESSSQSTSASSKPESPEKSQNCVTGDTSKNSMEIQSTPVNQERSQIGTRHGAKKFPISRKSPPGIDFLHLSDSSEDELLNELDAALLCQSHSPRNSNDRQFNNSTTQRQNDSTNSSVSAMTTSSNEFRQRQNGSTNSSVSAMTTSSNEFRQRQNGSTNSSVSAMTTSSNGLRQFPIKESVIVQKVEQNIEALSKQLHTKEEDVKSITVYCETLKEKLKTLEEDKKELQFEIKRLKEDDRDNLYLPQIKELDNTIAAQQKEIQHTKETLISHDALAKRKIASMQNDYKLRIDQVTKMYEDCLREKDTMVVNYAVAEQKNIEAKKATEKMENKFKEKIKEQESLIAKLKAMRGEKQKIAAEVDAKLNELSGAHKEMERMKEMLTSADVRIKWAQNKLKAELEAHKETKIELEKTTQKLKMAKEETWQIRKDCQAIVKQYQESEEIKSNSLDKELKLKESELIVQRQEKSDSQEVYNMTVKELDVLKSKHKDAIEELKTLRDKVYCLEDERKQNEETMSKYKEIIQKQKGENKTCHDKLGNLGQLEDDFTRAQDMIKNLDREIADLRITNKDLQLDIEGCRTRESELLELTQKLSRTNAKLQSENTNSNNQVVSLSSKASNMEMEIQSLEEKCRDLAERLSEEEKKYGTECVSLKTELAEKNKTVSDLKQKLEDEKDLNRTLKRKHANNIKDLTRQLHHAKKKLESYENHHHGEKDVTSLGSRTSSNGSLNTMTDGHSQHPAQQNHHHHHHHQVQPVKPPEPEYPVITEQVEVDKQVLIERIVRLQKAHARKNEKLEFLQDHIQQLVDEVQRKKRIIQSYILREEQGALAPEAMDENKALLAKKGGIMASLYSSHPQDGHMTLDLSLEINQKLQSVLEDTLLKNITLKENIDTLGQEIARLSKENRQLQLHLQGR
ncbi:coiled-coil domain-containing protein 186 [Patella vulgata]|uniref:coiled-coil domain-containing protein 186 n=1 Tax=Patella vulgata TaxID=6465 RepID=UPI0024AA0061|nr:coiled-coil domain-containing protein 186 [Patella vulgata]